MVPMPSSLTWKIPFIPPRKMPLESLFAMRYALSTSGAAERMVRINQLPLGLADLEEIVPERPDVILIPKVESAEQVLEVERRAAEIQASTWR